MIFDSFDEPRLVVSPSFVMFICTLTLTTSSIQIELTSDHAMYHKQVESLGERFSVSTVCTHMTLLFVSMSLRFPNTVCIDANKSSRAG